MGSEGAKRTGGSGGSTRWRSGLSSSRWQFITGTQAGACRRSLPRCFRDAFANSQNLVSANHFAQYMSDFSNVRNWLENLNPGLARHGTGANVPFLERLLLS